jgi:hypothetical protein
VLRIAVLGLTFLVFTAVSSSPSENLVISATLVPSEVIRVTGVVRPVHDAQVVDRHIVLCQWVGKSHHTYECKLTDYTTTTDEQGRFELTQVEPGEYLIIYDSGLADFNEGLRNTGRVLVFSRRL